MEGKVEVVKMSESNTPLPGSFRYSTSGENDV